MTGVAKGIFYTHFADRDDLESAITAGIRAVVERSIRTANVDASDPACRTARAMCAYFASRSTNPNERRCSCGFMAVRTSSNPRSTEGLVADVRAGMLSGRLAVPALEAGALFVLGVTQVGLMKALSTGSSKRRTAATAQQLCELVLCGFGIGESEARALAARSVTNIIRPSKISE